jgi:hypothetical protein
MPRTRLKILSGARQEMEPCVSDQWYDRYVTFRSAISWANSERDESQLVRPGSQGVFRAFGAWRCFCGHRVPALTGGAISWPPLRGWLYDVDREAVNRGFFNPVRCRSFGPLTLSRPPRAGLFPGRRCAAGCMTFHREAVNRGFFNPVRCRSLGPLTLSRPSRERGYWLVAAARLAV